MDEGARESKGWVKYVAIGCGVVLLLGACAFGLMFYSCNAAYRAATAPADEVRAFLDDLRSGDFDAALARTTDRFRTEHDLASFRALVAESPALAEHTDFSVSGMGMEPGHAEVRGFLRTSSGNRFLVAQLMETEDGGYAIDSFRVSLGFEGMAPREAVPGGAPPPEP